MSGGSYDYAYRLIEQLAEDISEKGSCEAAVPALRRAFKAHLLKVAAACRAVEWNDSCDGDSREIELIRACIAPGAVLEEATKSAQVALAELTQALRDAKGNA